MKRSVWIVLVVLFAGCASRPPVATGPRLDDGSLYQRLLPATATVLKDGQIAGAGAFISHQSHFLTAAHVVHKPADRIELLLHDGRVVPARTIAIDLGHDLALLETDLGDRGPQHRLGFRDAPPPAGLPIALIGAPSMLHGALVPGRVARDRPGFNFLGDRESYVRSWLITADAIPGTSGGVWVDPSGGIVGVQSAFMGDDNGSLGLGFIARVTSANPLIINRQDQPTATLGGELVGLRTQSHGFSKRFPTGSTGAVVHRVFGGGPLDRAGIPNEHLITHIDGRAVVDVDALMAEVRWHGPGQVVELTVVAPDKHTVRRVPVELGELKWD